MRPDIKREKRRKREKTPKQKADRSILGLVYLIVALFLGLMGYVGYFLAVSREDVINNSYNARLDNFSKTVERGKILSSDGTVLAVTEEAEDGSEVRRYPFGPLFSHVVGYSARGKTGLEALGNFYLLTSHTNPVSQIGEALTGRKNPGDQVVTTLDVRLQQAASDALGDKRERWWRWSRLRGGFLPWCRNRILILMGLRIYGIRSCRRKGRPGW